MKDTELYRITALTRDVLLEGEKQVAKWGIQNRTSFEWMAFLTEEVGELARAMNIKFGGKKSKFEGDGKDIKDEIADVLYTLLALANKLEVNLDEEFSKKVEAKHERNKEVYSK